MGCLFRDFLYIIERLFGDLGSGFDGPVGLSKHVQYSVLQSAIAVSVRMVWTQFWGKRGS